MSMTEPYPFPTSADEFPDKRVLVTGGTRGIGAADRGEHFSLRFLCSRGAFSNNAPPERRTKKPRHSCRGLVRKKACLLG